MGYKKIMYGQNQAPTTDEKVIEVIDRDFEDIALNKALKGIYNGHRKMGKDVLDAWEITLKTYIGESK